MGRAKGRNTGGEGGRPKKRMGKAQDVEDVGECLHRFRLNSFLGKPVTRHHCHTPCQTGIAQGTSASSILYT